MDLPMGVCPTRPTNLVHKRQCIYCKQVLPVVPGLMYTMVSHVCLDLDDDGQPTDERKLKPMNTDWLLSESEQEAHFEQLMADIESWEISTVKPLGGVVAEKARKCEDCKEWFMPINGEQWYCNSCLW